MEYLKPCYSEQMKLISRSNVRINLISEDKCAAQYVQRQTALLI